MSSVRVPCGEGASLPITHTSKASSKMSTSDFQGGKLASDTGIAGTSPRDPSALPLRWLRALTYFLTAIANSQNPTWEILTRD